MDERESAMPQASAAPTSPVELFPLGCCEARFFDADVIDLDASRKRAKTRGAIPATVYKKVPRMEVRFTEGSLDGHKTLSLNLRFDKASHGDEEFERMRVLIARFRDAWDAYQSTRKAPVLPLEYEIVNGGR